MTETTINPDLNYKTISLSTFRTLLAHYEATVHRVTRRKTIAKQTGKKGKPKARAPKKRKASQEEEEDNGVKEGGEDGKAKEITPEVSAQVDAADREFWELDTWRYETLPGVLRERLQEGKEKKGGKGVSLSKDEAVKLMEWKLKHGIHRPALLGMLKSNPERSIQSATTTAFASLPATPDNPTNPLSSESTKETLDTTFSPLLTSLNALSTPLRGIGPATASLFLSVASPSVPFYSDDTYLWLVVETHPVWDRAEGVGDWVRGEVHEEKKKMVRPNGELLVKYNVAEYRALWEAVRWLRGRLNGEKRALGSEGKEEGEEISCADVEKVAFVVRHAGESGLKGEGVVDTVKDDGRVEKDEKEGAGRKRRKVRK